jgi:hypothetical protein
MIDSLVYGLNNLLLTLIGLKLNLFLVWLASY